MLSDEAKKVVAQSRKQCGREHWIKLCITYFHFKFKHAMLSMDVRNIWLLFENEFTLKFKVHQSY